MVDAAKTQHAQLRKWRFGYLNSGRGVKCGGHDQFRTRNINEGSCHDQRRQSVVQTYRTQRHRGEGRAHEDLDILRSRENGLCTEPLTGRDSLEAFVSKREIRDIANIEDLSHHDVAAVHAPRASRESAWINRTWRSANGRKYLPGFVPGRARPQARSRGRFERTAGRSRCAHSANSRTTANRRRQDQDWPLDDHAPRIWRRCRVRRRHEPAVGGLFAAQYGEIGDSKPIMEAVARAKTRLSADLLKCCHHGSRTVTDEFWRRSMPWP